MQRGDIQDILFPRTSVNVTSKSLTQRFDGLPLEEVLKLIDSVEFQGKDSPLLATLYNSLGQAYQELEDYPQNRELVIQAYEKAVNLQTKLNLKADLAGSLSQLGNLYFEKKLNSQKAEGYYLQRNRL